MSDTLQSGRVTRLNQVRRCGLAVQQKRRLQRGVRPLDQGRAPHRTCPPRPNVPRTPERGAQGKERGVLVYNPIYKCRRRQNARIRSMAIKTGEEQPPKPRIRTSTDPGSSGRGKRRGRGGRGQGSP